MDQKDAACSDETGERSHHLTDFVCLCCLGCRLHLGRLLRFVSLCCLGSCLHLERLLRFRLSGDMDVSAT